MMVLPPKSSVIAALLVLVVAATTAVLASQGWNECSEMWVRPGSHPWQLPGAVAICREGHIAISYDTEMSLPAFSSYYITPERMREPGIERIGWYEDPDLEEMGIAQNADLPGARLFKKTWNHGHLAPDQLMDWSVESRDSCYTAANYAPQGILFNAGPWADLEDAVGHFVLDRETPLHVITGVAYDNRATPSVEEGVIIPDYFFMVLCDPANQQSVGFIGRNENIVTDESHKKRTVKEIEEFYGGVLFPDDVCRTAVLDESHWFPIVHRPHRARPGGRPHRARPGGRPHRARRGGRA
jgi:DNA/RNA endonuclease G (NUC1)